MILDSGLLSGAPCILYVRLLTHTGWS